VWGCCDVSFHCLPRVWSHKCLLLIEWCVWCCSFYCVLMVCMEARSLSLMVWHQDQWISQRVLLNCTIYHCLPLTPMIHWSPTLSLSSPMSGTRLTVLIVTLLTIAMLQLQTMISRTQLQLVTLHEDSTFPSILGALFQVTSQSPSTPAAVPFICVAPSLSPALLLHSRRKRFTPL
jgi:hypothetical protein